MGNRSIHACAAAAAAAALTCVSSVIVSFARWPDDSGQRLGWKKMSIAWSGGR